MGNINLLEIFNVIYEEQSGDYWTSVVGFIIALIGLVFIVFGIIDKIKYSRKVEATVLRSNPTYKTKRGIENQYDNTYSFEVDGKKYKVEIRENKEYERDDVNIVYYNKKDPNIARRINNKQTFIIGIIALILGLITAYYGFIKAAELLAK